MTCDAHCEREGVSGGSTTSERDDWAYLLELGLVVLLRELWSGELLGLEFVHREGELEEAEDVEPSRVPCSTSSLVLLPSSLSPPTLVLAYYAP